MGHYMERELEGTEEAGLQAVTPSDKGSRLSLRVILGPSQPFAFLTQGFIHAIFIIAPSPREAKGYRGQPPQYAESP